MSPITYVGIDDGFAEIKACWRDAGGTLQKLRFPSCVGSGAALTSVSGVPSNRAYVTAGRNYTVLPPSDHIDTRFDAYPTSDVNRVLVHHALRQAGLGGQRVTLCSGLPPGAYFLGPAGINDRLVHAKNDSLKKPVLPLSTDAPATIEKAMVCPEGVAAVFDHAISDEGDLVEQISETGWGVVDIGGRTTDVVVVVWDESVTIDHSRTGTKEIGVMRVRDLILQRWCAENDSTAEDVSGLETVLETRQLKSYGRAHDVSALVDQAIDEVGEGILNFVQQKMKSAARMDKILFVGGGAEVFRRVLKAYPSAVIPDDPAFANARGMLRFATLMSEPS